MATTMTERRASSRRRDRRVFWPLLTLSILAGCSLWAALPQARNPSKKDRILSKLERVLENQADLKKRLESLEKKIEALAGEAGD